MRIAYCGAELHLGNGESHIGTLITENERIAAVYQGEISDKDKMSVDKIVCLDGKTIIPGLIDVHTHGRAGYDFTSATKEQMRSMARSYLENGVTTLMPTLASAPFSVLCDCSDRIRAISAENDTRFSRFAGIHLEGRYLNPEKRGAHKTELLAEPSASELSELIPHLGDRFHISFAPECDTDGSFLKQIVSAGGTAGVAHTTATYKEAMSALKNGAISFTHTYNAMPALHHREGGAIAAALLSDAYVELIVDGIHISPEMVELAYRCKGNKKLVLVTDSMEGTGCNDGIYSIAGKTCIVKDGVALTEDGHLAGSTLSLLDGLFNLMRFCGITLDEAIPTATRNPARMIRIDDEVGTIEASKYADFLILEPKDANFHLFSVIFRGSVVTLNK